MIKQINPIYRKHATFDVQPEEFNEVIGEAERNEAVFQAQSKPAIILTTSGMLTGGPVIEYAQKLLPNARNRIVLTGYQDEGAPSRALRELVGPGSKSSRMVQITDEYGGSIEFEAAMPAELVKLSAHADRPGLLEYAGRMRPKHIALVHGYPDVQSELAFGLAANHRTAEITCGPSELDIP
jgi:predicted metal-dependent RNase